MPTLESLQPATLLRLLRGIDGLPSGSTGALVFTSRQSPQGTILIEDNRLCWAAASSMEHRLTHLLRSQTDPPLPIGLFEEIYEECGRQKRPLGETLVARGVVTRDGLKVALRQHTAEAIARLSATNRLTLTWASNRTRRYDAQFTFGTAEMLCSVGSLGFDSAASQAQKKLAEVTPENGIGLAFVEGAHHPFQALPVAQVGAEGWGCQSLVDLGNWARNELRDQTSVLASDTVQSIKRAWRADGLLFVRWSGAVEPEATAPSERFDLASETTLNP
jgi:hypothetical protein